MLKYLALAQKGTERRKHKGKGSEAVIRDIKREIEVLREDRAFPSIRLSRGSPKSRGESNVE